MLSRSICLPRYIFWFHLVYFFVWLEGGAVSYAQNKTDNVSENGANNDAIYVEGVAIPNNFLGFAVNDTIKNSEVWLGTSVSYTGVQGYVLDVYVYNPYRPDNHLFPKGVSDVDVESHLNQIVSDVYEAQKQGYYRNVNVIDSFYLTDQNSNKVYRCAELELHRVQENADYWSLACLGIKGDNYVKVRIRTNDLNHKSELPFAILQHIDSVSELRKDGQ